MADIDIIAFLSQKGGVGKSTLARAFAREASINNLSVKIADLDTQQGTVVDWHRQRLHNGHKSVASVESFESASAAVKNTKDSDLLVLDGPARASKATLEIAKQAHLVVIPSCASRDDLIPAIKLANELKKKGIKNKSIVIAITRVSTESEVVDAKEFISEAGHQSLEGCLFEKAAYRLAQNEGLAITETRYKTLNQKASKLIQSIIDLMYG